MKSATPIVLTGLCAALTAASPVDKRALVTHYEYVTVTATVTGFPPADTAVAGDNIVDSGNIWSSSWSDWPSTQAQPQGGFGGGNRWGQGNGGGDDGWGDGWGNGGNGGVEVTTFTTVTAEQPTAAPTQQPAETSANPPFTFTRPSNNPAPSNSAPNNPNPPASSSAPVSSSAQPAPTSVSSDYQQGILDSHNIHRSNHSVGDLRWDDRMASIAAQIAASCVYAHDTATGGGGYGQNIGAGSPPSEIPAMITNLMYNDEINFYPGYGREPDMSNFSRWGHFSQIVWKSTTGVGCATQFCPGGLANVGGNVAAYFTVCNYSPPGNFGGQYAANVLAPLGRATVTL